MSGYLIPSTDAFVEDVAKAIALGRLKKDAASELESMIGMKMDDISGIESTFEKVFEQLWSSPGTVAETQRRNYREDALAAIRTINLKLITSIE
jgi:hypothetical protein